MLLQSHQPTLFASHNTSELNKGSNPELHSVPSEKIPKAGKSSDYFAVYVLALGISVLPLVVTSSSVPPKEFIVGKSLTHFAKFSVFI